MLLPESTHALPARATLTPQFTASAALPIPSRLKGMRPAAGGNLRTWGKLCPHSLLTPPMPHTTQHLIEVDDLSMHYSIGTRQVQVLRDVSLRIAAGTRVAIAGPSGSGKTSLLLLLSGLERPAAGRIRIAGIDLASLNSDGLADLRRERIGIVFQSFHLLPSLSALDNAALPLQMAGASGARDAAAEMLRRVGLGERMHHKPSQLSGGEQQRVAIARALVHRPRLLLADEPTGNLDDHTAQAVRELLFGLNRELGTTLVLVTHDLDFAARCDRVLRLHEGRLQEAPTERQPEPIHALSA